MVNAQDGKRKNSMGGWLLPWGFDVLVWIAVLMTARAVMRLGPTAEIPFPRSSHSQSPCHFPNRDLVVGTAK